jgi:methionine sulfoxide reductase heme-binding subunit
MVQAINSRLRLVPVWAVYLLGALPAVWLFWLGLTNELGPEPVKGLEHRLGKIGLQFMVAVLLVTPLRRYGGVNLLRFRRALGLLTFFYILLHLMVWLFLDIQLNWAEIWKDIAKRPYITLGMAGFVAMLPLALTSNNLALRRMGAAAWQKLHRLTYVAALAGGLHYLLLVKAWPVEPILYLAAIVGLLALRLHVQRQRAAA